MLGIIALCESGEIELVSSAALLYKAKRNPNPVRRQHGLAVLEKANTIVQINDLAEVDYLCTCDDRFLNKAKQMSDLSIKIISPVALIEEMNL